MLIKHTSSKKDIKRIIQCILMLRLKLKSYKTIEKNESRGITDKLFNIIKFNYQWMHDMLQTYFNLKYMERNLILHVHHDL